MSGQRAGLVVSVTTGTTAYSHIHCGVCQKLLWCSHAERWEPQREWGNCPHGATDDEGWPVVVFSSMPGPADWHYCNGEMRSGNGVTRAA